MTPGPDREHDPQLAAMYRAGADVVPPLHLDDAIRAAARREVAAGPRRAGARRWAVPVALAAVLVLSVSVVTMLREQGADRLESIAQPLPETPALNGKRDVAAPPIATAPEASPKRRPPASPPVAAPAEPVAKGEAPAPAQGLPGRAAETERGVTAYSGESRAKATTAETTPEAPVTKRRDTAPQPLLRSAPQPLADAAGGAGVSDKPAAPVAVLAAEPARNTLWQDLVRESPEKWIQRITELRRAGKTADADALVVEFRRRFPDRRPPEDLR